MVVMNSQVRSQIESQNAQREKKISQLNEFIARFRGRHAVKPGAIAAGKEVERLQVTELAKSNIQTAILLKFEQKRPFGQAHSRTGRREQGV